MALVTVLDTQRDQEAGIQGLPAFTSRAYNTKTIHSEAIQKFYGLNYGPCKSVKRTQGADFQAYHHTKT